MLGRKRLIPLNTCLAMSIGDHLVVSPSFSGGLMKVRGGDGGNTRNHYSLSSSSSSYSYSSTYHHSSRRMWSTFTSSSSSNTLLPENSWGRSLTDVRGEENDADEPSIIESLPPLARKRSGRSLIHDAAHNGWYEILKKCLEGGEDQGRNDDGNKEGGDMANRVGERGAVAGLDTRDDEGWTPLHYAAAGNQSICVEILLQAASVGESSLSSATQHQRRQQLLSAKSKSYSTPFHVACRMGSLEALKALLRAVSEENKEEHVPFLTELNLIGISPVWLACYAKNRGLRVMEFLIEEYYAFDPQGGREETEATPSPPPLIDLFTTATSSCSSSTLLGASAQEDYQSTERSTGPTKSSFTAPSGSVDPATSKFLTRFDKTRAFTELSFSTMDFPNSRLLSVFHCSIYMNNWRLTGLLLQAYVARLMCSPILHATGEGSNETKRFPLDDLKCLTQGGTLGEFLEKRSYEEEESNNNTNNNIGLAPHPMSLPTVQLGRDSGLSPLMLAACDEFRRSTTGTGIQGCLRDELVRCLTASSIGDFITAFHSAFPDDIPMPSAKKGEGAASAKNDNSNMRRSSSFSSKLLIEEAAELQPHSSLNGVLPLCDVNYSSPVDGWTPLLCACNSSRPHIIETLLKKGADVGKRCFSSSSSAMRRTTQPDVSSPSCSACGAEGDGGEANPSCTRGTTTTIPKRAVPLPRLLPTQVVLTQSHQNNIRRSAVLPDGEDPRKGFAPLHVAASSGRSAKAVRLLLDHGADSPSTPLSLIDDNGWTPLHFAAAFGNVEVLRSLMERGPQGRNIIPPPPSAGRIHSDGDDSSLSPTICSDPATTNSSTLAHTPSTVRIDVDQRTYASDDARTPLHLAASSKQSTSKEKVEFLISVAGADVTTQTRCGWTALHLAALVGNEATLVKILDICMGASSSSSPTSYLADSRTEGDEAEKERREKMLRFIDHQQEADGWTALMCAAKNRLSYGTQRLLECGANPFLGNTYGWTALMLVADAADPRAGAKAYSEAYSTLKALLEWCQYYGGNSRGDSVFNASLGIQQAGKTSEEWVIVNGGHRLPSAFHRRVKLCSSFDEQVKRDREEGFRWIDAVNFEGWSALQNITRKATDTSMEALELFLSYQPEVDRVNNQGWTPLMAAGELGLVKVVQLLLQWKARVDVKAADDWTPLHAAAQRGRHEVCRLLLEAGADPDALNRETRKGKSGHFRATCSPFMVAVGQRHLKTAGMMLLDFGALSNISASHFGTYRIFSFLAATGNTDFLRQVLEATVQNLSLSDAQSCRVGTTVDADQEDNNNQKAVAPGDSLLIPTAPRQNQAEEGSSSSSFFSNQSSSSAGAHTNSRGTPWYVVDRYLQNVLNSTANQFHKSCFDIAQSLGHRETAQVIHEYGGRKTDPYRRRVEGGKRMEQREQIKKKYHKKNSHDKKTTKKNSPSEQQHGQKQKVVTSRPIEKESSQKGLQSRTASASRAGLVNQMFKEKVSYPYDINIVATKLTASEMRDSEKFGSTHRMRVTWNISRNFTFEMAERRSRFDSELGLTVVWMHLAQLLGSIYAEEKDDMYRLHRNSSRNTTTNNKDNRNRSSKSKLSLAPGSDRLAFQALSKVAVRGSNASSSSGLTYLSGGSERLENRRQLPMGGGTSFQTFTAKYTQLQRDAEHTARYVRTFIRFLATKTELLRDLSSRMEDDQIDGRFIIKLQGVVPGGQSLEVEEALFAEFSARQQSGEQEHQQSSQQHDSSSSSSSPRCLTKSASWCYQMIKYNASIVYRCEWTGGKEEHVRIQMPSSSSNSRSVGGGSETTGEASLENEELSEEVRLHGDGLVVVCSRMSKLLLIVEASCESFLAAQTASLKKELKRDRALAQTVLSTR